MLVAQQSAKQSPSHVENDDVNVHDVVELLPCAAMPKLQNDFDSRDATVSKNNTVIYLFFSHTDHTFYLGVFILRIKKLFFKSPGWYQTLYSRIGVLCGVMPSGPSIRRYK